jgi:peptidoglycan/xylan/chitin deacetylase (PgdA/CDA1 family)
MKPSRRTSGLLVLCYHNVESTWCFPARDGAGRKGMESQLRMLRRLFHVMPLDDAVARLAEGRPLPARAAAITFDDGYRDNLTLAVPMLERLGLPATFFLVPGLLANDSIPWWEVISWAIQKATAPTLSWDGDTLPLSTPEERTAAVNAVQRKLKRLSAAERDAVVADVCGPLEPHGAAPSAQSMFLDWDESTALLERGFAIGSHTCTHAILSGETPADQHRDLADSKRLLAERFAVGVDLLAYPNGTTADYDEHTLDAARSAGYRAALTTTEGFNRPTTPELELKRIVMYPERGLPELAVNLRYALKG